jgi:hypothetical protein
MVELITCLVCLGFYTTSQHGKPKSSNKHVASLFRPTVTWCAHLRRDEGSLGAPGSCFQFIRMYPTTPLSRPVCEKGSLGWLQQDPLKGSVP